MKKLIAFLLIMVLLLSLVACGNKLVEESEKTYYGVVTDRAMSVVNEGDRQGKAVLISQLPPTMKIFSFGWQRIVKPTPKLEIK